MEKKLIFIILSLFCTSVFGQSKCWCDSVFIHYGEDVSDSMTWLRYSPPSFKEQSDIYKIRLLLARHNCIVKIIVDTSETPKCIIFMPEIDSVNAEKIISEIKECKFSAATSKNKKVVAPLFLVPLLSSCLTPEGVCYDRFPEPTEDKLNTFIQNNLKYPDTKIKKGFVFVKIILDDNAKHIGYAIPKYSDSIFCNEALRLAKLIQFKYPAQVGGKNVYCDYTICIRFDKRKAKR